MSLVVGHSASSAACEGTSARGKNGNACHRASPTETVRVAVLRDQLWRVHHRQEQPDGSLSELDDHCALP